jgi:hypothetical protein
VLTPGPGVDVTGTGSATEPWVVSVPPTSVLVAFDDTQEVNFVTDGAGTTNEPMHITATLPLIEFTGGAEGMVMTQLLDGTWGPGPAVTAAPGSVVTGPGISGDGSAGAPLRANMCTYADLKAACPP